MLFLHRPDIIVFDEATAALDSRSKDRLMGLLSREFTDATVISIGHRPELAAFHQRKIVLERSCTGAKLVDEAGGPQPDLLRRDAGVAVSMLGLHRCSRRRRLSRANAM